MCDPYKIYSVYSKAVLHFNKFCLFNLVVIHLLSHTKKLGTHKSMKMVTSMFETKYVGDDLTL